jgi:hypothetical protein
MSRARKDVESGLLAKGFQKRDGDHTYFIYHDTDGKKSTAKTKTSHSGKDLDDSLLALMSKQAKLTKKQFLDLVDCPLSRAEYETLLRQNGGL